VARVGSSVGFRVGSSVGFRVGSSVGVEGLGHGGTGPQPAGLRSLPAKQHAPKARPTTDHRQWPAGGVAGQAVKHEWLDRLDLRCGGSRTFALDRRASRPSCTTRPRASMAAARPGGVLPPDPPPRHDRTVTRRPTPARTAEQEAAGDDAAMSCQVGLREVEGRKRGLSRVAVSPDRASYRQQAPSIRIHRPRPRTRQACRSQAEDTDHDAEPSEGCRSQGIAERLLHPIRPETDCWCLDPRGSALGALVVAR
jgi:hypothetical protein